MLNRKLHTLNFFHTFGCSLLFSHAFNNRWKYVSIVDVLLNKWENKNKEKTHHKLVQRYAWISGFPLILFIKASRLLFQTEMMVKWKWIIWEMQFLHTRFLTTICEIIKDQFEKVSCKKGTARAQCLSTMMKFTSHEFIFLKQFNTDYK